MISFHGISVYEKPVMYLTISVFVICSRKVLDGAISICCTLCTVHYLVILSKLPWDRSSWEHKLSKPTNHVSFLI
jgi:hypothetical protein